MINSKVNVGSGSQPVLVTLGAIKDGGRFRYGIPEWDHRANILRIIGHVIGTRVYGNVGSVRVRLPGRQHHILFTTSNGTPRDFVSEGTSELNWPTTLEVEALTDSQAEEALNPATWRNPAGRLQHQNGENPRTGANIMTAQDKLTKALQAKLAFQQSALDKAIAAGDNDKAEMAQNRINAIEADAAEKGIVLGPEAPAPTETATPARKRKTTPIRDEDGVSPEPEELAQTSAKREKAAASIKEARAAKAESAPKKAASKPRTPKTDAPLPATHDCICGCGLETLGLFRPGHDARVKGMLLKVERGEMVAADLPDSLNGLIKFAGRSASAGKENSDYRIVKSPVKFPGRDDIEVVRPER